ncbi:MAG: B12-binding domain-containing radical SAM protein [Elusimicrobia bacterium]|nr:B12-binding domain-containing radical SAM protein [Elusimicrobiota bacterium]
MKTNIVFISFPKFVPPFSFLNLASYINEKTNYKASILDLRGIGNVEEYIVDYLKQEKPDLVGFSCFTCDYPEVMKFSKAIKENYDCPIVVGNVHASLFPEDFIFEDSPVDFAVIGEGEITLAELIDKVSNGESCVGLSGLAALDSSKKMVVGEKRPLIEDLSLLPKIDYKLISMECYFSPSNRSGRGINSRSAIVFASRGCPSVCEFCAANTVWKCNTGTVVRFRPIEDVMEEVLRLKEEYKIQTIFFGDDSFIIKKDRVLEFCKQIKDMDVFWAIQGKVDQIDEELSKALRKAGCLMVSFGVESGSDDILKRIKKGTNVEQIKKAFAICKKCGLMTLADIMCNHPGETERDIEMTIDLLKQIKPDELSQSVMTPYPGTPIYKKHVNQKPENYNLFCNIGPDMAKYFKLCKHNRPLQRVMDEYWRSVHSHRLPGSVTLWLKNFQYFKKIVFSGYFLNIFLTTIGDFFVWARYEFVSSIPWGIRFFLRHWKHKIEHTIGKK